MEKFVSDEGLEFPVINRELFELGINVRSYDGLELVCGENVPKTIYVAILTVVPVEQINVSGVELTTKDAHHFTKMVCCTTHGGNHAEAVALLQSKIADVMGAGHVDEATLLKHVENKK